MGDLKNMIWWCLKPQTHLKIQIIVEFLHSDRDSRFPLLTTIQALTMDHFKFQIIMEEGEGGELAELADEEYLQQPMSFTGAEEACQHCPTLPKSSHIPHLHKPPPNTSPGYLLTAAVWEHLQNIHHQSCRDGKVRFGLVLEGILENPKLDYQFGPLIMVNLGPDHWFGPKRSGSGSQVVRTLNWTWILFRANVCCIYT